jgi:hypothetical protein
MNFFGARYAPILFSASPREKLDHPDRYPRPGDDGNIVLNWCSWVLPKLSASAGERGRRVRKTVH